MIKYIKKPIVIEAIKFNEEDFINRHEKYTSLPIVDMGHLTELWMDKGVDDGRYYIDTLEGSMIISEGDYIIKGIEGEFYPCKPGIFHKTYEKIAEQ